MSKIGVMLLASLLCLGTNFGPLIFSISHSKISEFDYNPMGQTIIVHPHSGYNYLACIPSAVYHANGIHVSPVLYDNLDNTAEYLLRDWKKYLGMYDLAGKTYYVGVSPEVGEEFEEILQSGEIITLPNDPVQVAAEMAKANWEKSELAILAIDGSGFSDSLAPIVSYVDTLTPKHVTTVIPKVTIPQIFAFNGKLLDVGPEWGIIVINSTELLPWREAGYYLYNPKAEILLGDVSAHSYPVTMPGTWTVFGLTPSTMKGKLTATLHAGKRLTIPVTDSNITLTVKLRTEKPTKLQLFLIDPDGNVRGPERPEWAGGNPPLYVPSDFWGELPVLPSCEKEAEVNNPIEGNWTAIVSTQFEDEIIPFELKATARVYDEERMKAASAATNAAVIASLLHAPLLYLKSDEMPGATLGAIEKLGVKRAILVDRGIFRGRIDGLEIIPLRTMGQILKYIDKLRKENYVVITSLASAEGFFAPASLLAAYHGAPVLCMQDASQNPYDVADRIWNYYTYFSPYYYGSLQFMYPMYLPSISYALLLPMLLNPEFLSSLRLLPSMVTNVVEMFVELEMPLPTKALTLLTAGLDQDLRWMAELHHKTLSWINASLDSEGNEAFAIVSPTDDIRLVIERILSGSKSICGRFPGVTPEKDASYISRSILYPALIWANPHPLTASTSLLGYAHGARAVLDTKISGEIYQSEEIRDLLSSNYEFDPHITWNATRDRLNEGVCFHLHSSHGVAGSGCVFHPHENWGMGDKGDAWREYEWWTRNEDGEYGSPENPDANHDGRVMAEDSSMGVHCEYIRDKHIDEELRNLHSALIFHFSCALAAKRIPLMYMDHGAVLCYHSETTSLAAMASWSHVHVLRDVINGLSVGTAQPKYLIGRDFQSPSASYYPHLRILLWILRVWPLISWLALMLPSMMSLPQAYMTLVKHLPSPGIPTSIDAILILWADSWDGLYGDPTLSLVRSDWNVPVPTAR
jgi:hypothetical protein